MATDRRALANSLSRRWWQEPDESLHQAVDSVVDIIAARQAPRHEALLRHARLYGDLPILGFGAFSYARVDSRASLGRLSLNVIRNCCNAVTAKSCKGEVRPYFLTSDGDYDLQQRAKKLQQLTEGLFHTHDVHGTTTRCFMDAAVFGTGIVKVFRDGDDVCIERVFPGELQIDDAEGLYGNPRTMYQEKYIDRQVLMELYPDSAEKIGEVWFESDPKPPLLIKFLFTTEALSVQVHPEGKTEMWHILAAEPGARIAAGFRKPITAERLRESRR